jgi:hypothetical protein
VTPELESWLVRLIGASKVARVERIQSLWGGYGELVRAHLVGGAEPTVIMKWVRAPRARDTRDVSHRRKARSYDVEQTFYRSYASRCEGDPRVARHLGQRKSESEWVLALEDLDAVGFSRRLRNPRGHELEACLRWLARFHARFLGTRPEGLWKEGTYWHLETRPDELRAIAGSELFTRAPELDAQLREARHRTLVHGDAKPANFCFDAGGREAAAVDFQYVGGGCGMRDVAYLLHGSVTRAEEEASLARYFDALRAVLPPDIDPDALEREWRALYPIAIADFERFLAGWRG